MIQALLYARLYCLFYLSTSQCTMLIWQRMLTVFCYFVQLIKLNQLIGRSHGKDSTGQVQVPTVRKDGKKQDIGNSAPSLNTGSRGERCKGLVNVMLAHVLNFLTTGNKISSLEMKKRKKHN